MGISDITIVINGEVYLSKCVYYYISKCLLIIPENDLNGISKINVFQNAPSHFPSKIRGGYYPPNHQMGNAKIDIYMNNTFYPMLLCPQRNNIINRFLDHIYISLFGNGFISEVIFHEIGHHKYYIDNAGGNRNNDESEIFADEYSNKYLNIERPIIMKHYNITNKLFKLIYKKRILATDCNRVKGG